MHRAYRPMTVTLITLVSLTGTNRGESFGGLFADTAGDLFGTTELGSSSNVQYFDGTGTVQAHAERLISPEIVTVTSRIQTWQYRVSYTISSTISPT